MQGDLTKPRYRSHDRMTVIYNDLINTVMQKEQIHEFKCQQTSQYLPIHKI
jgi:hypothetical protein